MISTRLALAAALLGAPLLCACQPRYDGIQIRFLSGEGQHSFDRLEVEEGQAVLIEVRPLSSNPYEDYAPFDLVELEAFNENILFVAPATDLDRFVLAGAGLGQTVLRVSVNGEQEDELTASVVEQVSP